MQVISEKEHPIKNLIRREKNRVHERHEKHEQNHVLFVLFVFFVDDSFGGFIIGNHLTLPESSRSAEFFKVP